MIREQRFVATELQPGDVVWAAHTRKGWVEVAQVRVHVRNGLVWVLDAETKHWVWLSATTTYLVRRELYLPQLREGETR